MELFGDFVAVTHLQLVKNSFKVCKKLRVNASLVKLQLKTFFSCAEKNGV